MSIESLANMTIAARARILNDKNHNIGTPVSKLFDMPKNQHTEPGDRVQVNLLYKDENYQHVTTGADEYRDDVIDPFEEGFIDWRYSVVTIVLDGKKISKNLGGMTIDELMMPNAMMRIPSAARNTLINQTAPRFMNGRRTMRKEPRERVLLQDDRCAGQRRLRRHRCDYQAEHRICRHPVRWTGPVAL